MNYRTLLVSSLIGALSCLLGNATGLAATTPNTEDTPSDSIPVFLPVPPAQANDSFTPTLESTADTLPIRDKMQLQAEDPTTGKTVNIDISSNDLTYSAETQLYVVTGDVYIIIPEKSIEILADKVTFDAKTSTMLAAGNVYIISGDRIIGSTAAQFDLENNTSTYTDAKTVTKDYRLQAKEAQRTDQFTILHQGRLIMDADALSHFSYRYRQRGLRLGSGAVYSYFSAHRSKLLYGGGFGRLLTDGGDSNTDALDDSVLAAIDPASDEIAPLADKAISPNDVAAADFNPADSQYRIKAKRVDIYRKGGGFDEVVFKHTRLKYQNMPILYTPVLEFGYNEDNNFLTYLGPDIGYNVDYGGFFLGPGWDFRLLDGWFKYSPILSYGGGNRLRASANEPQHIDPELGFGFLGHFRSPNNSTDFGYGTTLREPIFLSEQRLFGRSQTRIRLGVNQYYREGFFGIERPNMIAEVADASQFRVLPGWLLRTFVSAGVAKDEFFPTRQSQFFVDPKSEEPIVTPRLQVQGQLISSEPILYLGNVGAFGAIAQTRLAVYGTGDSYFLVQGGPYLNVIAGPLYSQLRYFYNQSVGGSPFVFDTYYRGRNYLQSINSIDIGPYLTVGALHGLSLNQDNARNDMIVDRKFFVSTGSKNVRFSAAYDVIQKRSFFGITINPEGGQLIMDFDTLNLYQPGYNSANPPLPSESVVAPKKPTSKASPATI